MSLDDQQSNWSVECSDEESYFDSAINYRRSPVGGGRIWEPSGEDIARLYGEMETVGFNRLQWQCPGRISPSQLQTEPTDGQFENPEDSNSLAGGSQTKSKFDFDLDSEFDEELPSITGTPNSANRVTAKRTQVVKKSQTNLNKVMFNIKKYQMIEHGGGGSGAGGRANAPVTSTSNSTSTTPVSASSTFQSSAANNGTSTTTTTTTNNSTISSAESEYDQFQ